MYLPTKIFGGMKPIMTPDLLNAGDAQQATNTKLESGSVAPYMSPSTILALSGASPVETIYRFGQSLTSETQYWFQFDGDVDVAKGPINGDTEERTYWTDGAYPKKTNASLATGAPPYPTASLAMGIPKPVSTLTLTVSGTPTSPLTDPVQVIVYTVTYVSSWGEEGPAMLASGTASWQPGQSIHIDGLPVAPTGPYDITGLRLYRSAKGTSSTQFQLVNQSADIAIGTTTYDDATLAADLGEVLSTATWLPPPDNMIGLTVMPNGVLAGFFDNTVCFCEPFEPYAWPVAYQQSTDAPIVGIASFDQSLLVGTTTGLYVLTGTDPGTMTAEKLPVTQSLASKRSLVAMNGGIIFAAQEGLYMISSAGLTPLTEGTLLSREQWRAYSPGSLKAYNSNNRYIAFFDNGSRQGALVFTFGPSSTFCESDQFCTAGYRDKAKDALYLVQANEITKWDSGTPLTYTWTSNVFKLPTFNNLGVAQVDAASYPVTFQLYADGVLKHTQTVADKYAFRLPSGYRSARYHFTITGTSLVREVEIATAPKELTHG